MEIRNYEDVDLALKRICECEVEISKIEGEVTLKCNEIKEAFKNEVSKLENEKNFLEQCISNFCDEHKSDFIDKRSRELVYGSIGYRVSKSVKLPRVKAKVETLLSAIKKFGLKECITYEEKPNKEALCELDENTLVKLGLKREIKDNFRIEPKIESLGIE